MIHVKKTKRYAVAKMIFCSFIVLDFLFFQYQKQKQKPTAKQVEIESRNRKTKKEIYRN